MVKAIRGHLLTVSYGELILPVGFVPIAKPGKATDCNPVSVGSNPTGDFWLIGITHVNTKWWEYPPYTSLAQLDRAHAF